MVQREGKVNFNCSAGQSMPPRHPPYRLYTPEHAAAMDWTHEIGHQEGDSAPDWPDQVMPLPRSPDYLLSYGSLNHPTPTGRRSLFSRNDFSLFRTDARVPWRADAREYRGFWAMPAPCLVLVVGRLDPIHTRAGTHASIMINGPDGATQHDLVKVKSGMVVIFEGSDDALERMAATVMAGGHLPPAWAWAGNPNLPPCEWRPNGRPGVVIRRGTRGWWEIEALDDGFAVSRRHDSKYRTFRNLPSAFAYCREND